MPGASRSSTGTPAAARGGDLAAEQAGVLLGAATLTLPERCTASSTPVQPSKSRARSMLRRAIAVRTGIGLDRLNSPAARPDACAAAVARSTTDHVSPSRARCSAVLRPRFNDHDVSVHRFPPPPDRFTKWGCGAAAARRGGRTARRPRAAGRPARPRRRGRRRRAGRPARARRAVCVAARSRAYPAAVSWLTMNAQSLDERQQRLPGQLVEHRVPRPARGAVQRGQEPVLDALGRQHQVLHRRALPDPPVLARAPGRPAQRDRPPDVAGLAAPRSVVTRTPARRQRRSTASSHAGPSCHQCPNSSVSKAATTSPGRPSRSASRSAAGPAPCRRSRPRPGVPPPRPVRLPGLLLAPAPCRPVTRAGRKPEAWSKVWKSRYSGPPG